MILHSNFGDLYDARVTKIFADTYDNPVPESMIPVLFGMETSKRAYEIYSSIGSFKSWTKQSKGLSVNYQDFYQGYDVTFTPDEYADGYKVERKLIDDDMWNQVENRTKGFAIAGSATQEEIAAYVLNAAFTSTVTGGDAVCLCNSTHPTPNPAGSSQGNAGTTALSATSVEATRQLGYAILDDAGKKAGVRYDMLIVPRGLEQTAWEIINSTGKVDTANNNKNFHYGKYQLVVWDYLSDANNWFMADSRLLKMALHFINRLPMEFERDKDFDSKARKYSGYMRNKAGFSEWRPVYGHAVS